MRTRRTRAEVIQRDRELFHAIEQRRADYLRRLKEIREAITYGCFHEHVHGMRRLKRHGEQREEDAYAIETRLVFGADWKPDFLWGREWWCTNRKQHGLIAWTEDRNGRIVRGWARHLTYMEWRSYDTPGDLSCPGEATWLPAAGPGLISFPAFPFQRFRDDVQDPQLLETIQNLRALRDFDLENVDPHRYS